MSSFPRYSLSKEGEQLKTCLEWRKSRSNLRRHGIFYCGVIKNPGFHKGNPVLEGKLLLLSVIEYASFINLST